MNYIGNFLPEDVRKALKRNNSPEDIRNIVRATGVSSSAINYLLNGSQPMTEHTAKAFERLVEFAKDNTLQRIKELDIDRSILSDISDHIAA